MRNRVVVTGLGVLSSAGASVEPFARSVVAGERRLVPVKDSRATHGRASYAGLVGSVKAPETPGLESIGWCDKFVWMAAHAAREAIAQAGLEPRAMGSRMGLLLGTCSGPMLTIEAHYERIVAGEPELSAEALFAKQYESGARALAHRFGIEGLSATVVTACSSSLGALGLAADLIRIGWLDAALVGGSDTFAPTTLAGFDALKATCEGRCAPFSRPIGLNLGEAAAFFVLENVAGAEARHADVHAEILGFGISNDAYHCSAPDPTGRGQALAMTRALADAGLDPASIGYVNAHGTGTEANDKAETKAIRRALGERADDVPVSSSKSMVGHCLGAAGAVEMLATIACAKAGVYPCTAGFNGAREGCTLDYVPEPGRPWQDEHVCVTNNFAFGGNNSSIAFRVGAAGQPAPPDRSTSEDIVITAVGLVSAVGIGRHAFVEGVRNAATDVTVPAPWAGAAAIRLALVRDDDNKEAARAYRRLDVRHMDKAGRLATLAAALALQEAGLALKPAVLAGIGLFLHLGSGSTQAESEHVAGLFRNGFRPDQLSAFPYVVPSSVAGNVCRALTLTGHNTALCGGAGAGLAGLLFVVAALKNGHVSAMLSGAVDELSERFVLDRLSAGLFEPVPDAASPPPGEGAAMLMLETESHARARGATVLARIRGLAGSTDVEHPREADAGTERLEHTVRRALAAAGVEPDEIGTVCCQAGASRELQAVRAVLARPPSRLVHVAARTGWAAATQPLFDLSYALLSSLTGQGDAESPILCLAGSPSGTGTAMVLEPMSR